MIQQTDISRQTSSWQSLLQTAVTDPLELCRILQLDPAALALSPDAANQFPLKVPRSFIDRMQPGNPQDPLLRQVLAVQDELLELPGLIEDPLQEAASNPLPGLLHKYGNRVLLTLAASCAVNCRYCFRRHFDYAANNEGRRAWPALFHYLHDHPEVDEVILSGGDPLMASDDYLTSLIAKLAGTAQIKRLRIHTRLPVVVPQRILQSDLGWLKPFDHPVVVLHINHANEIDSDLQAAVARLRQAGSTVMNQAVLLAGVNDNLEAQLDLHRRSFDAGILPYYLHLPDQVRGTAHFQVTLEAALSLMSALQSRLSGYLLPRLITEEPGKQSKSHLL